MIAKILDFASSDLKGFKVAILGLTFKANTDDMRYSPSLSIVPALIERGADISVYDPEGMQTAKQLLTDNSIYWAKNSQDCYDESDLLVILTEWNEFKEIDLKFLKMAMKGNKIVDLRNILNKDEVLANGFDYDCIGK
jgi:UDPglucose 6-dehydrogenase